MNRIIIFLILCFIGFNVNAQFWKKKDFQENYILSLNIGTSRVITEFQRDLGDIIREMNHRQDYAYSLGITKALTNNISVGYEYSFNSFKGEKDNPNFSAYRYDHYKISQMELKPVIYNSRLKIHSIITNYQFNNFSNKKVIPFLTLKAGLAFLSSELMYASNYELIFAKIGWNDNMPNASTSIVNFNFGAGGGMEWIVHSKVSITCSAELHVMNDDNLDGVHNYNAPHPEGYKNFVSGLYGKFLVGISYYINQDSERQAIRNSILRSRTVKPVRK